MSIPLFLTPSTSRYRVSCVQSITVYKSEGPVTRKGRGERRRGVPRGRVRSLYLPRILSVH